MLKGNRSQKKMAANGNDKPDLFKLFDFPSAHAHGHPDDAQDMSYENSGDMNSITRRQMQEDMSAYRYDIEFCRAMLARPDISPQETRSLHVRLLDCSHHVRHCQHRIELIDAQSRLGLNAASGYRAPQQHHHHYQQQLHRSQSTVGTPGPNGVTKRKRPATAETEEEDTAAAAAAEGDSIDVATSNSSIQRLGFWKCRLCMSQKYLNAGPNRVPSEPSKWPLRDVSKMLNHYLDLHTEHTPEERCKELGAALAQNQGPFEYWLTRTRLQDIKDLSVIDEYVDALQGGSLPEALRNLNRAAAAFPNTISGIKK
ncbi:hypothetical protein DL768_006630 [Monosporascus sp. mg162]|nr:hypothetical protein DL768_006630 [Monosporascus sp. mg162]